MKNTWNKFRAPPKKAQALIAVAVIGVSGAAALKGKDDGVRAAVRLTDEAKFNLRL